MKFKQFRYNNIYSPIIILVFFFTWHFNYSQENQPAYYLDTQFFGAKVLKHSTDVGHLYGFPNGQIVSFNKRTFGEKLGKNFNFPDYGFSLSRVDFNNLLGNTISIGFHYNFYFLKRQLMLRFSQGFAYADAPYNRLDNNKNVAFGTYLLGNAYLLLQYQKSNVFKNIGFQAGLIYNHFSNGGFSKPNRGINIYGISAGLNYDFGEKKERTLDEEQLKPYSEPFHYNIAFRTGFTESIIIGSGIYPFYHFSIYADKRWHKKSAFQFGTDIFFSQYLKEFINFYAISYQNREIIDPNTDYKRIGIFAGHELFLEHLSFETQLGFYVYKPFKIDKPFYQQVRIKHHFNKNIFVGLGLKAHGASAENFDLTVGYRFK